MGKRVIIVEDDILLRENLSELLRMEGYDVTECGSGEEFMDRIGSESYKVAIIDVGLPDKSGYEIASEARKTTRMGIIILTSRTGIENKIQGFSSGADYYFSKPVDIRELIASINNMIERLSIRKHNNKNADTWTFNKKGWLLISPSGHQVSLTSKESDFISMLEKNGKDGVDKESMLKELGYLSTEPYGVRALSVMVTRFRKKLKYKAGENELIKTVHGFGFSLGEKLIRL